MMKQEPKTDDNQPKQEKTNDLIEQAKSPNIDPPVAKITKENVTLSDDNKPPQPTPIDTKGDVSTQRDTKEVIDVMQVKATTDSTATAQLLDQASPLMSKPPQDKVVIQKLFELLQQHGYVGTTDKIDELVNNPDQMNKIVVEAVETEGKITAMAKQGMFNTPDRPNEIIAMNNGGLIQGISHTFQTMSISNMWDRVMKVPDSMLVKTIKEPVQLIGYVSLNKEDPNGQIVAVEYDSQLKEIVESSYEKFGPKTAMVIATFTGLGDILTERGVSMINGIPRADPITNAIQLAGGLVPRTLDTLFAGAVGMSIICAEQTDRLIFDDNNSQFKIMKSDTLIDDGPDKDRQLIGRIYGAQVTLPLREGPHLLSTVHPNKALIEGLRDTLNGRPFEIGLLDVLKANRNGAEARIFRDAIDPLTAELYNIYSLHVLQNSTPVGDYVAQLNCYVPRGYTVSCADRPDIMVKAILPNKQIELSSFLFAVARHPQFSYMIQSSYAEELMRLNLVRHRELSLGTDSNHPTEVVALFNEMMARASKTDLTSIIHLISRQYAPDFLMFRMNSPVNTSSGGFNSLQEVIMYGTATLSLVTIFPGLVWQWEDAINRVVFEMIKYLFKNKISEVLKIVGHVDGEKDSGHLTHDDKMNGHVGTWVSPQYYRNLTAIEPKLVEFLDLFQPEYQAVSIAPNRAESAGFTELRNMYARSFRLPYGDVSSRGSAPTSEMTGLGARMKILFDFCVSMNSARNMTDRRKLTAFSEITTLLSNELTNTLLGLSQDVQRVAVGMIDRKSFIYSLPPQDKLLGSPIHKLDVIAESKRMGYNQDYIPSHHVRLLKTDNNLSVDYFAGLATIMRTATISQSEMYEGDVAAMTLGPEQLPAEQANELLLKDQKLFDVAKRACKSIGITQFLFAPSIECATQDELIANYSVLQQTGASVEGDSPLTPTAWNYANMRIAKLCGTDDTLGMIADTSDRGVATGIRETRTWNRPILATLADGQQLTPTTLSFPWADGAPLTFVEPYELNKINTVGDYLCSNDSKFSNMYFGVLLGRFSFIDPGLTLYDCYQPFVFPDDVQSVVINSPRQMSEYFRYVHVQSNTFVGFNYNGTVYTAPNPWPRVHFIIRTLTGLSKEAYAGLFTGITNGWLYVTVEDEMVLKEITVLDHLTNEACSEIHKESFDALRYILSSRQPKPLELKVHDLTTKSLEMNQVSIVNGGTFYVRPLDVTVKNEVVRNLIYSDLDDNETDEHKPWTATRLLETGGFTNRLQNVFNDGVEKGCQEINMNNAFVRWGGKAYELTNLHVEIHKRIDPFSANIVV